MNSCEICGVQTKNSCSNCKQVFYCCVQHQKQHWSQHKANCHPFKIATNDVLGRHLIATRTIKPSEIILREAPILRGPLLSGPAVCLGCLNAIDTSNYVSCERCNWPLCSEECKNSPEHCGECDLFVQAKSDSNSKWEITDLNQNPHPLYVCINTIRGLVLRKQNPDLWNKLNSLESLEEERRGSMQWNTDYNNICKVTMDSYCVQGQTFTEDEVMRVIGLIQINGHEVPTTEPAHVAVYYRASLIEHSCLPNVAKTFTKDGELLLWAPKSIRKGSHLSICYSDAIWGTSDRQAHLMQTKIFRCHCLRCEDQTECGTKYSALKCELTSCDGLMLPLDKNAWQKDWVCDRCNAKVDKFYVNQLLERAGNDLNAMDKTAEKCIKYLEYYRKWLPEHHYFMSEVKLCLVQKISPDAKDLLNISDKSLQMKITYCRELLQLFEILAPCEVRCLGLVYFELHSALAEMTRRNVAKNVSGSYNTTEMLEESRSNLDKCIHYLQYESEIFIEGLILKQAKSNRQAFHNILHM